MRLARAATAIGLALGLASACGARTEGNGDGDVRPRACAAASACDEGSCVFDRSAVALDLEPAPLICGAPSAAGEPGSVCTGSDDCALGLCVVAGTCVAPCAGREDCGRGEDCRPVLVRTGSDVLSRLSACVRTHEVPADVAVDTMRMPGALTGAFDTVRLPATTGTTIHLLSPDPAQRLDWQVLRTRDAVPVVLFDVSVIDERSVAPLNPPTLSAHLPTVLLPSGPSSILSAEGYEAVVESTAPGALQLTVLSRASRGGTLDIDIFYVGVPGLAPMGDRGPPQVATALDRLASILARVRVVLGTIRQHEVVGALARRLAIIDGEVDAGRLDYPELRELFALGAGLGRPSLPVFLVRSIDSALGMTGAIPGAHGVHGTPASGLAIGVDTLGEPGLPEGTDLGRTLAHEIGHFLGLFHTSEINGFVVEPLPDTPECRIDRDGDGDGTLSAMECDGAGAHNLMFWGPVGEELTTEQGDVIRRGLVLR